MWVLWIIWYLTSTWAEGQNGRSPQPQDHNGHGWDIRLAVPGEPGNDYPTLGAIPRTTFSCAGREPGYYADIETNCQVFRVCTVGSTYGFQSFLCPNGTLFNQGVLVCDWWMNVDCKNSQQLSNINDEKFENLRLGPQLMKDIKKMLTHPMLNPYDRSTMKSNLIIMQDYKPPLGQLFPNGALLAGPERPPNNVYVPAKQTFSASTPNPRYIPGADSNYESFQRDDNYFQRQEKSNQYIRNGRVQDPLFQNGNLITNSHAGRFIQHMESDINNGQSSQLLKPTQITNLSQKQRTTELKSQINDIQVHQNIPANGQRVIYSEPETNHSLKAKQNDFGVTFTEPTTANNHQPYTYTTPASLPQFLENTKSKAGRELKENLVSKIKQVPSTVVTKTYNRILHETKVVKPKSRVTIKTWIVKPTKAGRQLVDSNSYTYASSFPFSSSTPFSDFPSSPIERLVDVTTPYIYEKPTTPSLTEKIISTDLNSDEAYIYTKPTPTAEQIRTTAFETTQIYIAPTTSTRNKFPSRLILPSTPIIPTKPARYYLTPSAFKSINRFYLPPPQSPTTLPRLYLPPNFLPQPVYYQNAQVSTNPTIPPSTTTLSLETKQPSLNYGNNNNITFADILNREKLDITVHDIVKDTDNILKTACPPGQNQYRKNLKSLGFLEDNFLTKQKSTINSDESLTSQVPLHPAMAFTKSGRVIATPATSLLPPKETNVYQNINQLSKLPFYKESGLPNTIERTVSIKITIPEKLAMYLFKNQSEDNYDKLEILNTGSSNYLVLSNNHNHLSSMKTALNFIPIAKLSENNNSKNISDSQALVYSFLADSINVAREYRNIAQQEILSSTSTPTPAQFQNIDRAKLSDITNRISELTSSQFSSNNLEIDKSAKLINIPPANINQLIPLTGNSKYINDQSQARQIQTQNNILSPQIQGEFYSSHSSIPNGQRKLQNNQLYSGQLYQWPVPEVTKHISSKLASSNLVNPITIPQHTTQMLNLQQNTNRNYQGVTSQQLNPGFEIIKAQTLPIYSTKLQLEAAAKVNDREGSSSQESFDNLLHNEHGISAHLQDKIVGTLPHPLEENKLVTYEKDQSYYLYTKFDDNTINQNPSMDIKSNTATQHSADLEQGNNAPNLVSFQLIPSVNYELEDEKEQQNILNAFQIDEFGAPREIAKAKNVAEDKRARQLMTTSVDFTLDNPTSNRRSDRYNMDTLYSGPSSYTAPQSSIGRLENRRNIENDFSSRLEDFETESTKGYPKERPTRRFIF